MVKLQIGAVEIGLEGVENGLKLYTKGEEEVQVQISPPKIGGLLKVLSGIEGEVRGRKGNIGFRFYQIENGYRLRVVRWEGEETPRLLTTLTFRGINLLKFIEALKEELPKVNLIIIEGETKILKSGEVLTLNTENSTELLEPRETKELALLLENKDFVILPYEHGKLKLTEEGFWIGNIEIQPEEEKLLKLLTTGKSKVA